MKHRGEAVRGQGTEETQADTSEVWDASIRGIRTKSGERLASLPPLIPLSGSSSSSSSISTTASSSSSNHHQQHRRRLPLLDPPSPAGICLLLLLRELFLELGGEGGRSPPPSLLQTLGKASGGKEGRGILEESRGEATPWVTGEPRGEEEEEEEKRISLPGRAGPSRSGGDSGGGGGETKCHRWMRTSRSRGAALPGSCPEEPLMEPCLALQRGVFNQCDCPTFSVCVCVCLPPEPEGGLLMAAAVMAMVAVVVVVMMMRWQWRCSRGFWLSPPSPSLVY
ncbi:uncharacterized protein LOC141760063 [Sebastes fasciatus]|uniref:uncharacterized protein LOC141760063 n=1 Tax=Sebastes fasciatus TaxID=394691 RepID=UPI003D9E8C34